MKDIFDYFLELLNNNDKNLIYKGNFIFRMFDTGLTVYEPVEGKLVSEAIEFRPVSLMVSEAVPFVEANKRVDWLIQFALLVPIKGQTFDESTDIDYNHIAGICSDLNGSKVIYNGKTYAFKVNPYPKYEGWDFVGKSKYAILSVTMNITEGVNLSFGQDAVFKLDSVELDVVNADVVMSRRFYIADDKANQSNDYFKTIGRQMQWTLTINYDSTNSACVSLMNERNGSASLKKTYTLAEGLNSYTVSVKNCSESLVRNSVRRLVVVFVSSLE